MENQAEMNGNIPQEIAAPIVDTPETKTRKFSSIIMIIMSILMLGGVGFGVYGMFFQEKEECPKCEECEECEECKECECKKEDKSEIDATAQAYREALDLVSKEAGRVTEIEQADGTVTNIHYEMVGFSVKDGVDDAYEIMSYGLIVIVEGEGNSISYGGGGSGVIYYRKKTEKEWILVHGGETPVVCERGSEDLLISVFGEDKMPCIVDSEL